MQCTLEVILLDTILAEPKHYEVQQRKVVQYYFEVCYPVSLEADSIKVCMQELGKVSGMQRFSASLEDASYLASSDNQ